MRRLPNSGRARVAACEGAERFMRNKIIRFILVTLVLTGGFLVGPAAGENVAFFYALDEDLRALKESAREMATPVAVGTRKIHRLVLGSHTVYAVKMGSGAVETAISAQALLSRFRCDWAFAVGPAGALSDEMEIGRWYRVERIIAWQRRKESAQGNGAGDVWDIAWSQLPGGPRNEFETMPTVTIVSGEAFIQSLEDRDRLRRAHQADAVDMNSYGLAAVSADHGVPLFVWKVISDHADEKAGEQFLAFIKSYDGAGGRMMAKWIAGLPVHPANPEAYPAIKRMLEEKGESPWPGR